MSVSNLWTFCYCFGIVEKMHGVNNPMILFYPKAVSLLPSCLQPVSTSRGVPTVSPSPTSLTSSGISFKIICHFVQVQTGFIGISFEMLAFTRQMHITRMVMQDNHGTNQCSLAWGYLPTFLQSIHKLWVKLRRWSMVTVHKSSVDLVN